MWQLIVIAQQQQPGCGDLGGMLVPFALIFLVFYFLIIRPQQKQQQEHQDFLAKLKVGDEVVTTGGICGKVKKVGDKTVTLEVARGTKIEVVRGQVQGSKTQILSGAEEKKSTKSKEADDEDTGDEGEDKEKSGEESW